MNIEFETKNILRMDISLERKVKLIIAFANFNEKNIIKAIKKGGNKPSEIYSYLVHLSK